MFLVRNYQDLVRWYLDHFVFVVSDPESCLILSTLHTAKPQVLLVGQYSVGKTSFIRYLLGQDFPGQRIGPEPTTDRFTGRCRLATIALFLISHVDSIFLTTAHMQC